MQKIVYVVAGALIDAEGRVLMCSRPEGKEFAGFWEFPGGKIETGETPQAALCRELKEELGIGVSESDLREVGFVSYSYARFHLVMLFFACRKWTGNPIPLENQQAAFVNARDIAMQMPDSNGAAKRLPPADEVLVKQLQNYLSC